MKRAKTPTFTPAEAARLISYDPLSGTFRWKARSGNDKDTRAFNSKYAGSVAGCLAGGRQIISILGERIPASRLAFAMMDGKWPPEMSVVDHIDGNPRNDAWSNLRLATSQQNQFNRASRSKSGFKGVSSQQSETSPWVARIKAGGKQIYLGCYQTKEEAALAYNAAAIQHFGEYAVLNVVDFSVT